MSRENVKKFYELAETDKDFAQKLASLDSEMPLEASDLANLKDIVNEKIIPLAKEKGLDFTAEEMVEFASEQYMRLSEDDLLEVSGGVEPKKAAWGLSTVLLLSLGSAAAINLMNNNHDDVNHVVSEPSKTASEEKDESEDEEALKKSLDEMMKKSPKGADKNANMEDIEKELDKLFKGGKRGGGAFRPGKGRTAGKNMLNRTIGKKGTSDFDPELNELLKHLQTSVDTDAEGSTDVEKQGAMIDEQLAPTQKQTPALTAEKKQHKEAKPAPTTTSARIEETTKPAPTSKGTPKKIEKTKEQFEAEKKQAQQQVNKRLSEFKAKFETSFKENFKTQCDDEDLKVFVQEYLATSGNLGSGMLSNDKVEFSHGFSGGSVSDSVNVLDFAKELNETLPKATYKAQYSIFKSWKNIMSPVMEALRNVKYDINKFDDVSRDNMIGDINNIYNKIHELGYLPGHSEYGRSPESNERKTLEVLRALKESNYNKDDARVQTALKALSGDKIEEKTVKKPDASGGDQARRERERIEAEEKRKLAPIFESREAAQQIVDGLASNFKLTVKENFNKNHKTQLSEEELQQFVSGITGTTESKPEMKETAIAGSNTITFFIKGQLKNGTSVETTQPVDVFVLAKELNAKLPKVTTAKELQQQAEMQVGLARSELDKKFNEKIAANNGIELNEANLNKLISETLKSYKSKENIDVNEQKSTVTFTAKGITKGLILTGADSRSATLNVREFFTKLNNEATEARRASEREDFDPAKYVAATDNDVIGGVELARKTAKKMIQEEFNKIVVAKYNAEKPAKKATSVADISAGKVASIAKSLNLAEVASQIVKANLNNVDDFKIKGAKELNGQFSIKTAPENKELKIGAIGYKKTGLLGTSTELIKYGDEISIREEVEKLIEKTTVAYKTVIGGRAGAEAEALYKFLTDNKLVENGTVVESVLDTIKDSDKEHFKKDVKHIADQISGSEGKYTLSGKWRSYNVAQEKLKAIKDLAGQLGV